MASGMVAMIGASIRRIIGHDMAALQVCDGIIGFGVFAGDSKQSG